MRPLPGRQPIGIFPSGPALFAGPIIVMKRSAALAFTLIELLIVIGIVALLAGIILPVYSNAQLTAKRLQSLSNMRQLGVALLNYCGDNNGQLPSQGDKSPTWKGTAVNSTTETAAWYNVLPRTYGNTKGVGDYVNDTADFYGKGSLFYVPAAKYPATKLSVPMFAVTYGSKLFDKNYDNNSDTSVVRLQNFQSPANTCVFQESGVTGETIIRGQKAYNTESGNNQPYTYASRTVARYGDKTVIVFADGHAALVTATDIVSPGGTSYVPQIGTTTSPGNIPSWMSWTPNPNNDATQ